MKNHAIYATYFHDIVSFLIVGALTLTANILDALIAGQIPPIRPDSIAIITGKITELKSAVGVIKLTIPKRLDMDEIAYAAHIPNATPKIPPTRVMNIAL